MTMKVSITDDQRKQYKRFVEDAGDRGLKEVNPDKDGLQRLLEKGGGFQTYIIAGIKRFTAKAPSYDLAHTILGNDFITAEEIMSARPGIVYSAEQISKLADTIPSEEVLRSLKDSGYGLMPQSPSEESLLDIRAIEPALFYRKTGGWFEDQKFARNDRTGTGWLAIKKTPVDGSTSKNWDEQNKLLSKIERVPNAAETSWFITTFFKVRGVYLFPNVYVRTSSIDSDGGRVDVGHFHAKGLIVDDDWGSGRGDGLGLASARKF
jgi:hypothetical protein